MTTGKDAAAQMLGGGKLGRSLRDDEFFREVDRIHGLVREALPKMQEEINKLAEAQRALIGIASQLAEVTKPSVPNVVPRQSEVATSVLKGLRQMDQYIWWVRNDLGILRTETYPR